MEGQTIILIERKGRKQFTRFIELFKNREEIPIKEIRSTIPKSTFYEFIDPNLEAFIVPTLQNNNGKIVQTFKRNCNIEIIDEDPNFFYLRLKANGD